MASKETATLPLGIASSVLGVAGQFSDANQEAPVPTHEIERQRLAMATEERRRKERLKRVLARQRASFGARGLGATGGSGAAVLQGLSAESDRAAAEDAEFDRLRLASLMNRPRRRINLFSMGERLARDALAYWPKS